MFFQGPDHSEGFSQVLEHLAGTKTKDSHSKPECIRLTKCNVIRLTKCNVIRLTKCNVIRLTKCNVN